MNVYDFDKTIFPQDSSFLFYIFCLKKKPLAIIKVLPDTVVAAIKYKWFGLSVTCFKEKAFSYLRYIDNATELVEQFWKRNLDRVYEWYKNLSKPDDVVISASPYFLLKPVANELGFFLIATEMDSQTGIIQGLNCSGEEKEKRFRMNFTNGKVDNFYSDSYSDNPMALIADSAFICKKGRIKPW